MSNPSFDLSRPIHGSQESRGLELWIYACHNILPIPALWSEHYRDYLLLLDCVLLQCPLRISYSNDPWHYCYYRHIGTNCISHSYSFPHIKEAGNSTNLESPAHLIIAGPLVVLVVLVKLVGFVEY